ncbi:hypothetical protein ACQRXC_03840 [Niallia taxi]|uniref:hypothetical protein n=1 Tax=Niallia taxi TaxID=2499688 RepID=UPI003F6144AB
MTQYVQTNRECTVTDILKLGTDLSTFQLKGFKIKGTMAIHPIDGTFIPIHDMYDKIRNVRDDKEEIIAKRRSPKGPLLFVKKKKL